MPPRRYLNLFAFPSETNALFSMLILVAVALALFLGNVFRFYSGLARPIDSIKLAGDYLGIVRTYFPIMCLPGLAAFGVLGLALFLYLRHPSQIRRRRNIQPLTEKDWAIQEHAGKLALQAGVDPPAIEMPPHGLKGSDAQAFGVGKAQTIALDGGFRILRRTKPGIFTALLHHELAHFANADIGRSYFSDALWRSIRWLLIFPFLLVLIAVVVIRFFLGLFINNQPGFAIDAIPGTIVLFIQWGFVIYIAGVIWARILRMREFHADWRAAIWGSRNGLNEILQEEIEKEIRPKAYFRVWKLHPTAGERRQVLQHPEILFRLSPAVLFLTGLLFSFIFVGLYFSLASFVTIASAIMNIHDASTGLSYWVLTGIWWSGFALLILFVFGLTGWLVNGVLLPQIQKQVVWALMNRQGGLRQYTKMVIPALILVAGFELGFFMTPFNQFAPDDLLNIAFELFIVVPILTCLAWCYFSYIQFTAWRLSATHAGRSFSVWRKHFMTIASGVWAFLFFIPGIVFTRFLDAEFRQLYLYLSAGWLAFTLLLSPLFFAASWIAIKLFFDSQPKKCPHCGRSTGYAAPAIEFCEHCGQSLGEWLFVSEKT